MHFEDAVRAAIGTALAGLEHACTVQRREDATSVVFDILPLDPACAAMSIRVENSWLYLGMGEGTVLEIGPNGQQFTNGSVIQEVTDLVAAVAAGELKETLWIRNNVVLRVDSELKLPDGPIRVKYGLIWNINPFRRVGKKRIQYPPYGRNS